MVHSHNILLSIIRDDFSFKAVCNSCLTLGCQISFENIFFNDLLKARPAQFYDGLMEKLYEPHLYLLSQVSFFPAHFYFLPVNSLLSVWVLLFCVNSGVKSSTDSEWGQQPDKQGCVMPSSLEAQLSVMQDDQRVAGTTDASCEGGKFQRPRSLLSILLAPVPRKTCRLSDNWDPHSIRVSRHLCSFLNIHSLMQ